MGHLLVYICISKTTALVVEFLPWVWKHFSHCQTIATGRDIIDITSFDLFKPASHDLHLYNGLKYDIKKLLLPKHLPLESRE